MKKREINKEKQKLKKTSDFKMIRFARYICIAFVLIFLFYVSLLVSTVQGDFAKLFETNLFVTVGFIISALNIFIWYLLKLVNSNLEDYKNIDSCKVQLILVSVTQIILFNYACAALTIFSLIKYFKWNQRISCAELKKQNQTGVLIALGIGFAVMVVLAYTIVIKAMTI